VSSFSITGLFDCLSENVLRDCNNSDWGFSDGLGISLATVFAFFYGTYALFNCLLMERRVLGMLGSARLSERLSLEDCCRFLLCGTTEGAQSMFCPLLSDPLLSAIDLVIRCELILVV
jgi:hypothetical protein